MMLRLERIRGRVKKYSDNTANSCGPLSTARRYNLWRLGRLEERINKAASKFTGHSSEASAAFIVFNNKESYRRCVADYALSKYAPRGLRINAPPQPCSAALPLTRPLHI